MIGSWEAQLQTWHTQPAIPEMNFRLEQYFQNTVLNFPDRMAVFDLNSNVGMTYEELDKKSDLLAKRIFRTLKDHDRKIILVFLDPGILFPQVILAILKSGFIFLPLDSNTPMDRIRFIIKDANIRMVITQGRYVQLFSQNVANNLIPANIFVMDAEKTLDFISSDSTGYEISKNLDESAYCMYTGGKNGLPGILISHKSVCHSIRCEVEDYLKHSSRRLTVASHSADVVISDYFGGFASACTVYSIDWESFANNALSILVENSIDTIHCSPARLATLDGDSLAKSNHKLDIIMLGGDSLPSQLLEKWLRLFPHVTFINCYGPIETTITVSMKKFNFKDSLLNRSHVNISLGKPYPGTAFYVVDPKTRGRKLQLVGRGEIGELLIGGAQVCSGYLNRPQETTESFVRDPFGWDRISFKGRLNKDRSLLYRTGDLVCWNTDGEIEFRGKMDVAYVKIKGQSVDLFGIQGVMERIPQIMMVALKVESDDQGLDSIVAYVKLKIDATLIEIIRECKRRLEGHEVPNKFIRIDEYPVSRNGKIDFKALSHGEEILVQEPKFAPSPKQQPRDLVASATISPEEVMSQDEISIAAVIRKRVAAALNQPEIIDFSDKIDLVNECGMTSIHAARLCAMLRNIYPTVEIDPNYIMQYARTPSEIASRVVSSMIDSKSTSLMENTKNHSVSSVIYEANPAIRSYTLTDQATLFYGTAFYSRFPAWFVNYFRPKFSHMVRIYAFTQFKPLKAEINHPYRNRIDPIRLHNALERLFVAHPVLRSQLVPVNKTFPSLGKYSKSVSTLSRVAPLIVSVKSISFSRLEVVMKKMEDKGLKKYSGNLAIAYSLEEMKVVIAMNHAVGDSLFANVLVRQLELFYEDPKRKDIPVYHPIDFAIMESKVFKLFPNMDKYAHLQCFNFPAEKPSLKNGFTSTYRASHDRIIVNVMVGKTTDTLTEGIPLVTSVIAFVSGYLSYRYRQKRSKRQHMLIAGFNELRTICIPGYSGISIHQLCNVMKFSCSSPSDTSRIAFKEAYRDKIQHRLAPEERIIGVSQHSLDINIKVDSSPFSETFLFNQCGRLTNTAPVVHPVAMGAVTVDMVVASEMDGICLSFLVSHTIPLEIRQDLIPMIIDQLFKCRLVAYAVEEEEELPPLPLFHEPEQEPMIQESPEPAQHPTFDFNSEPDHDEPEQDSRPKLNLSLDLSDEEKAADENKKQDAQKAIRKPRIIAKLDAEKLLSADGLPKLLSDSRKLRFKGKGHEAADLEKLLSFFQLWGHNLFPKLKFKSFVDRAEKICKEKRTRMFHSAVLSETKRNHIYESSTATFEDLGAMNMDDPLDLDKELEDAIMAKKAAEQARHDEFMSKNDSDDDDLLAQIVAARDRALAQSAGKE